MAITVEITRGDLLPDLLAAFGRGGCDVERITPTMCRVYPTDETPVELAFFVRAWQLGHRGVRAEVRRS